MPALFTSGATFQEWSLWDDEGSGASPYKEPWDVTFAEDVATFKRCYLLTGPVTVKLDDIEYTVEGDDGEIYLAAKWDTNAVPPTVTIIEGATLASVTDSAPPADEFFRRLLYVVKKTTTGGTVSLSIEEDHRRNPMAVAYV